VERGWPTPKDVDLWIVGEGLFTKRVNGKGVRSMKAPGTAYDDPILGRDPQPGHMDGYVKTDDDNGGVHINSGILNRAFCLAAVAMGGRTWEIAGRVWYIAVIERLEPDSDFRDFARATTDIAGERYGKDGHVQRIVRDAWKAVGLDVPLFGSGKTRRPTTAQVHGTVAGPSPFSKWRPRSAR